MIITAELSLYPLRDGPIPAIIEFIEDLQSSDGVDVVPNQLSTQLRGEFGAVTGAINRCMERVMTDSGGTVVLVVKYLNVDRPIGQPPALD